MENNQPITTLTWLHRDQLNANLYNPNMVAPPEMELLRESILADGWLFPIVVFDKSIHIEGITNNPNHDTYTIIDGFHRHKISGEKQIYKLTGGKVPVIILNPKNPLATTVRLNRAKGTHAVLKMAEIVSHEIEAGKPIEQIMNDYGMEKEEVIRLANRKGVHQTDIVVNKAWSKSWTPK